MSLSVIRGGGTIGSRRRRPSRPVRLRVFRMPRVGPPAATCSSIVLGFDGFRCVVSPPPWPPLWPLRRRRWPLPVASTSGVASSRWVAAVSPARPSVSSASTVVGFFPPRPRPPRRRRRFFGPVGELSPSAASGVLRSVVVVLGLAGLGLGGGGLRLLLARLRARPWLLPRRGLAVGRLVPLRFGSLGGRARGARSAAATAATTASPAPGSAGARLACLAVARGWPRLVRRRRLRLRCGDASCPLGPRGRLRCCRALRRWLRRVARVRVRARARVRAAQARRVAASPRAPGARPSASPGPCPRWRLASASPRSGQKAGRRVPPVWCLDPSVGSLLSRCARGGCTRGTDRDQRPPMGGTAGSCCMKARAAGEPARRATCCLHSVRSFGLALAIGRGALIGCLRRSRATSTIDRYSRTGGGSGPAVTSAPRIPAGVAPTVEPEPAIPPGVGHLADIPIPSMNPSSAG